MGSFSSKNRGVKYSLCVIDVFTKYAWFKSKKVAPIKQIKQDALKY